MNLIGYLDVPTSGPYLIDGSTSTRRRRAGGHPQPEVGFVSNVDDPRQTSTRTSSPLVYASVTFCRRGGSPKAIENRLRPHAPQAEAALGGQRDASPSPAPWSTRPSILLTNEADRNIKRARRRDPRLDQAPRQQPDADHHRHPPTMSRQQQIIQPLAIAWSKTTSAAATPGASSAHCSFWPRRRPTTLTASARPEEARNTPHGQDTVEALRLHRRAIHTNAHSILTTLGVVDRVLGVITTDDRRNGWPTIPRERLRARTDVVSTPADDAVDHPRQLLRLPQPPRVSLREVERLESRLPHAAAINRPRIPSAASRSPRRRSTHRRHRHHRQADAGVDIGARERPVPHAVRRAGQSPGLRHRLRDPHPSFRRVDPLNKSIKIGRASFRVIGVMEKQGGSFLGGPNFDRQIFVPITSYVKAFGGVARPSGRERRGQGAVAGGDGRPRVRGHRGDEEDPPAAARRARRLLDQQARHAAWAPSTT